MTQEEIKAKIATIEKAITALKKQNGSPDQIKKLEDGLAKYESMLTKEEKSEPVKQNKSKSKAKAIHKKKPVKVSTSSTTKVAEQETIVPAKKKKITIKPKSKVTEAIDNQVKPKDITIEQGDKKETHVINTAFDKDIKNAVLVLNKERFKIREITDRKTKKVETVHHSPEYKNAKTIQNRVNAIFESSIYDIAKTAKEKIEKKPIIDLVNELKDLHTLWLAELDMIISNEEKGDLEAITKLIKGLIREAAKNDGDGKWKKAGGLAEIAKKYGL